MHISDAHAYIRWCILACIRCCYIHDILDGVFVLILDAEVFMHILDAVCMYVLDADAFEHVLYAVFMHMLDADRFDAHIRCCLHAHIRC